MADQAHTELQFGGQLSADKVRELARLVINHWNPDEYDLPDGAICYAFDVDAPGPETRAEVLADVITSCARIGVPVTLRGEVSSGCLAEITTRLAEIGLAFRARINPTDYFDGECWVWRPGYDKTLITPGSHDGEPMVPIERLRAALDDGRSLAGVVAEFAPLAEDCPPIVVLPAEPLRRVFLHRGTLQTYLVWLDPESGAIQASAWLASLDQDDIEDTRPDDMNLPWLREQDAAGNLADITSALAEGRRFDLGAAAA